jgi:prevent-host-death family protein
MSTPLQYTFTTTEAQANFPELIARVQSGEVITITQEGEPVARLQNVNRSITFEERSAAIEQFKKIRADILPLKDITIRELINEGRR